MSVFQVVRIDRMSVFQVVNIERMSVLLVVNIERMSVCSGNYYRKDVCILRWLI